MTPRLSLESDYLTSALSNSSGYPIAYYCTYSKLYKIIKFSTLYTELLLYCLETSAPAPVFLIPGDGATVHPDVWAKQGDSSRFFVLGLG